MSSFSRYLILAALGGVCLAAMPVTVMAQDDGNNKAVSAQQDQGGAAAGYQDLIERARKKGFKLTREEYEELMQKNREQLQGLKADMSAIGQTVAEMAEREGRDVLLTVVDTKTLVKGQESRVTLRATYKDNGDLVTEDRLQTFHTKPIHVMLNEPQLSDYTHAHPAPTEKAGEYEFTFVPRTDCSYRAWVDIYPYDGREQTPVVDIPGAKDCSNLPIDKVVNTSVTEDGLTYSLRMDTDELAKDQDTMLYFDVTDKNGQAFSGLQPVMGAYAHLVGFRGTFDGVAHVHPMGEEPMNEEDRGGPTLGFHVRPKEAGYMRFYLQVLIDGRMHFLPFGVNVAEKGKYSGTGLRERFKMMKHDDMMIEQGLMPEQDSHDAEDGEKH